MNYIDFWYFSPSFLIFIYYLRIYHSTILFLFYFFKIKVSSIYGIIFCCLWFLQSNFDFWHLNLHMHALGKHHIFFKKFSSIVANDNLLRYIIIRKLKGSRNIIIFIFKLSWEAFISHIYLCLHILPKSHNLLLSTIVALHFSIFY